MTHLWEKLKSYRWVVAQSFVREMQAMRRAIKLALTPPTVRVEAKRGATESYVWGRKSLKFVRCTTCGCVVCWRPIKPREKSWMGVNYRNFPLDLLNAVRVRKLDGAAWDGHTH